jgi:hypothetical protein
MISAQTDAMCTNLQAAVEVVILIFALPFES